jgi:hypothetical protein
VRRHSAIWEEAVRVLSLLAKLPETTARQAIAGISNWLNAWQSRIARLTKTSAVWLKLWPIAVEATNASPSVENPVDLRTSEGSEPVDLDTLNTPAGKLVGVFLESCPPINGHDGPFAAEGPLRTMRDVMISTGGRSGLIVKHRLIESLRYFLHADRNWAEEHLITPLISDGDDALALWRAIARQTHFLEVLEIIGDQMAERANDRRLGARDAPFAGVQPYR